MTADFGFEGEGQFESELCTVRFNLSDGGVAMTKQMYNELHYAWRAATRASGIYMFKINTLYNSCILSKKINPHLVGTGKIWQANLMAGGP